MKTKRDDLLHIYNTAKDSHTTDNIYVKIQNKCILEEKKAEYEYTKKEYKAEIAKFNKYYKKVVRPLQRDIETHIGRPTRDWDPSDKPKALEYARSQIAKYKALSDKQWVDDVVISQNIHLENMGKKQELLPIINELEELIQICKVYIKEIDKLGRESFSQPRLLRMLSGREDIPTRDADADTMSIDMVHVSLTSNNNHTHRY